MGKIDYRKREDVAPLRSTELDICIVTYNRPFYLKRCIWSILAATSVRHKIFVIDDNSTDGETRPFIKDMHKRGLIHDYIFNEKNNGTARNFNDIITRSTSKLFVMANDDMYFHRWWDFAVLDTYKKFDDCGIVSFYDYTRYGVDKGVEKIDDYTFRVLRTGLGCSLVTRELFEKVGGFSLPHNHLMGYLATPFCVKTSKVKIKRNKHYATIPNYATHMDLSACRLNERVAEEENGYADHRRLFKRAK